MYRGRVFRQHRRGETKKLTGAARYWAAGGAGADDTGQALDAFGLDARLCRADCYEVWRDNLPALDLFLAVATQWKWLAGMERARRVGLDYAALEAAMRMLGVAGKGRARMFGDIRAMECAALEVFNGED